MYTNVGNLFGDFDFYRQKTPNQKEFESKNKPFLLSFKDIVFEAFENMHQKIFPIFKPSDMDRNMPSVSMISFIRQGIIRKFPLYCRKADRKRFRLVTPTNESLFIKKLDDRFLPSNIQTFENQKILAQCIPGEKTKGSNVFLGYTVSKYYERLTGVYAVCIYGHSVIWITDISLLGGRSESGTLIPITPKGNEPKLKDGIVKVRKTKKE